MRDVAVGILQNETGKVFVQRRKSGEWEFPGGKTEKNETPRRALARELKEETGITVTAAEPWLRRKHPRLGLVLHFFRVTKWRGEPSPEKERGGYFADAFSPPPSPLLPANELIWKWLRLPPLCAVTAAEIFGAEESLRLLARALENGLRLVQLRDKNLPEKARREFAKKAAAMTRAKGALLLINDDENLAREVCADGLHLSGKQLAKTKKRPPFLWTAASCHDAAQLQSAAKLNLDFAVLSPVAKTLTHVKAPPLGWRAFAKLAQTAGIPVYALGGLTPADAPKARRHNAQGIAAMRKAWK